MKLSEGIRIGSKGKKQITGQWYTESKDSVCAIGALMCIPGVSSAKVIDITTVFPELTKYITSNHTIMDEIVYRNDCNETFEQIIKWLESIGQ